jgi:hypothetical protein
MKLKWVVHPDYDENRNAVCIEKAPGLTVGQVYQIYYPDWGRMELILRKDTGKKYPMRIFRLATEADFDVQRNKKKKEGAA